MKHRIALLTALLVACSDAGGPGQGEPLVLSNATVTSAINFVATGHMSIPADCGSNPTLNCTGGNPGSAIPVTLTVKGIDITRRTGVDSLIFDWGVDVQIVGLNIPFTINTGLNVLSCTAAIDTRPGADSTVHISGTATFKPQRMDGPIDRVDLAGTAVTGFADDDISIGSSLGCQALSIGTAFIIDALSANLFEELHLCSAPGPTLFIICKP